MAGLMLKIFISHMLFHEKMHETVHDILLGFLYILLNYCIKINILQGRKL